MHILNRIIVIFMASAYTCSCASTNPLNVNDTYASYLLNNVIYKESSTVGLTFIQVNDKKFNPGFFSSTKNVKYTIPSGGCYVVYRIVYIPKGDIAARFYQRYAAFHLDAEPGNTYQANASIDKENDLIETWIEDLDGNRITKIVSGKIGKSVQEESIDKLKFW